MRVLQENMFFGKEGNMWKYVSGHCPSSQTKRRPFTRGSAADAVYFSILAQTILSLIRSSLKELDANALKTLSQKVNVIPLIAKADSLTAEEKLSFKRTLLRDFEEHQIKTFPSDYPDQIDGADELLVSGEK